MPHSLPGRVSDCGPTNRRCECGSITYDSRRDCAVCLSPVCSDCPGVADAGDVGLVCAKCVDAFVMACDESDIPAIDAVREMTCQFVGFMDWADAAERVN